MKIFSSLCISTDTGGDDYLDKYLSIYEDGRVEAKWLNSFGSSKSEEKGDSRINPKKVKSLSEKIFNVIGKLNITPPNGLGYGDISHTIKVNHNNEKREIHWHAPPGTTPLEISDLENKLIEIYNSVGLER